MTKYGAIMMDPPWHFRTRGKSHNIPQRAEVQHYPTMSLHEIAGLPIPSLAAKNCALFMWITSPHLVEALKLFDMWDFAYKTTAFVWAKTRDNQMDLLDPQPTLMSMGYWTRKETEICLLATKGSPKRLDKGVRELIQRPRRQHSRKPDDVYDRIERLVAGPYLEYFARQQRDGWDQAGNEVDKFEVGA